MRWKIMKFKIIEIKIYFIIYIIYKILIIININDGSWKIKVWCSLWHHLIIFSPNHPNGLKRSSGKFSTVLGGISGKKFLNHRCFLLHDHSGEFLMGLAHSTKSLVVHVMWRPPKVELGDLLEWFIHTFCINVFKKQILQKDFYKIYALHSSTKFYFTL